MTAMKNVVPDNKPVICKNCQNSFHGAFCNLCGQDGQTSKINWHFLYHEIQHGIFHVDRGILYTIKELFTRPGHSIREFIEGKRVKHFKPFAFLLVITGLYAFINHFFNARVLPVSQTSNKLATGALQTFNEFAKEHYAVYELMQLPLLASASYLLFKKYRTSFLEHAVINSYLMGQRILIRLLLLPVSELFEKSYPLLTTACDFIIGISLFTWAYRQYYATRSGFTITWKAIAAYIVNLFFVSILASIILSFLASIPNR
jgi:hypothetical protein